MRPFGSFLSVLYCCRVVVVTVLYSEMFVFLKKKKKKKKLMCAPLRVFLYAKGEENQRVTRNGRPLFSRPSLKAKKGGREMLACLDNICNTFQFIFFFLLTPNCETLSLLLLSLLVPFLFSEMPLEFIDPVVVVVCFISL